MKYLTSILLIFISVSCREFYDEEFEENNLSVSEFDNRTYFSNLTATDSSVSELTGSSEVEIKDGTVVVNLDLTGIPSNLLQVHYGFSSSDCGTLSNVIPNEVGTTRSFSLAENSSVEALQLDLKSSGVTFSGDNIGLEGMSFIVKAFSNFSGLSSATGTDSLIIACGVLK